MMSTSATGRPLTKRGEATRAKLLDAAEHVFAELGFHEASIVRITERAGIGLGTFYLYFGSKQAIFEALVHDLSRRVRRSMSEEIQEGSTRIAAERAGFRGFFRFTAAHPALYRVIREAETNAPDAMRAHYTRIVEGYEEGLRHAQERGELPGDLDPHVTAWSLMGIGEMVGMRFLLWERDEQGRPPKRIDDDVFEAMMRVVDGILAAVHDGEGA